MVCQVPQNQTKVNILGNAKTYSTMVKKLIPANIVIVVALYVKVMTIENYKIQKILFIHYNKFLQINFLDK